MENISYVGLSRQMVLQRKMEMTANNIANMNTPGFKSQSLLFQTYLNEAKHDTDPGNSTIQQVSDYGSYRNLTTGSLTLTHNELDIAIEGEGYFALDTDEGIQYTRAGNFALNDKREIVTKDGYRVMDESNNPLIIPDAATHITVSPEGQVSTNIAPVGRMKIVTFNNEQDLQPVGENIYNGTNLQEQPAENAKLAQGMIEGSNVNPIVEMNRMIDVLRSYQSTQKMLQQDHERMRTTIQKLTRV